MTDKTPVDKLSDRFDKIIEKYDELFAKAEEIIPIDNKTLKQALKEQLPLQLDWEVLTKRINKLFDSAEHLSESAYSSAVSSELKDSYRTSTITEAKEFAKSDAEYKKARRLLIEIRELKDEAKGVLEVINSRKYILNNLTNAVVSSTETHII